MKNQVKADLMSCELLLKKAANSPDETKMDELDKNMC